ncbi:MAG: DUF167 domain-containing protein [Armatimonadetes bacterium]|nr:DUF167 domain-containing protein [Armatimonadota bacterium]
MSQSLLKVRVTPKSSREDVVVEGELIRVYVRAVPADGEANQAVEKVLAKSLKVPKSAVEIVKGLSSREKTVSITGLTAEECIVRLQTKA